MNSPTGDGVNQVTTLNYQIDKKERDLREVEVVDFNLGEGVIQQASGITMPYQIRGTMAVPKEAGQYPVVFIAHGRHNGTIEDARFDTGFEYLTEELAQQGYIAISLDINAQYIFQYGEPNHNERLETIYAEHLKQLIEANGGKDVGYSIDLKDKVDLDNIILVGHSKAGQMMLELTEARRMQGDTAIKGVLSVTPAEINAVEKYVDVPIALIVSEYDEDVVGLDGFTMYNQMIEEDERESMTALAYLKGGNHNFFNSIAGKEPALNDRVKVVNPLSQEEQKEFLVAYTIDFTNAVLSNNFANTVFDIMAPTPNTMYGYSVITKLNMPSIPSEYVVDVEDINGIKSEHIIIQTLEESWMPDSDTLGAFRDPRVTEAIDVLTLSWQLKGASATFDTSEHKNFSKYNTLSLDIAQNPAHEFSQVDSNQALTIMLVDAKGASSKVVLGTDTTVLQYVSGEISPNEEGDAYTFWTHYTPIGEIRIPLSYFEGINSSEVVNVSFIFDQTDSGSLVVENLTLK